MYSPIEIGLRIKARREELSLTLDDIADKVKVSKSTIQRYETGKINRIKLPVIGSIADALDVPPDWLLGLTNEKIVAPKGDDLPPLEAHLMEFIHRLTDDQKKMLLAQIEVLLRNQE